MPWIFGMGLAGYLAVFLLTRSYKKNILQAMKEKGDFLRVFYPMAAKLVDLRDRFLSSGHKERLLHLLRCLYVKENVEREYYGYRIRKTSVILAISAAFLLFGFGISLQEAQPRRIFSLQRPQPGEAVSSYQLDVSYRQQEERLQLDVQPLRLTESEILELFEWSFDDVKEQLLGDNPSADAVSEPLHLISEYAGFQIFWEVDDLSALDYSGNIRAELKEQETRLITLYAEFSMDDVTQMYTIPLKLVPGTKDGAEQLKNSILEGIQADSQAYEKEVKLPTEIQGEPVEFRQPSEHRAVWFLILAIFGGGSVFLLYDRALKEQIRKRQQQMMRDFPEIVSKLSLLYEAGLSIHGAFARMTRDYEKKMEKEKVTPRFAYQEMQLALEKIASGTSEREAYAQFGRRCGLYPYIKLGNLLEQNLSKGAKGMQEMLNQEVNASLEERKRFARKKGEEAGTKLLLPMGMLLVVVIAVIALPALMSIRL